MILSFCVIAYNAEKTLPHLFSDLLQQDYPHNLIEIILVDSASTDKTKYIMQEFANDHSDFLRVTINDNVKKTLPCGWNVALNNLKGNIVLRVDAHTSIPKDFISKNVKCIKNGEDICGGRIVSMQLKKDSWQDVLLEAESSMFGGSFALFRRSEKVKYTNTLAFAAYRKEVFDKVGYYNENLARTEDNEMHYRMRKSGYEFYLDPDIVSYRFSRSSLKKLLKQKYMNGYWIGLTMGICPMCFSFFHFVPLLFVIAILISTIFAFLGNAIFAIFLWSVYVMTNLLMSIFTILSDKITIYSVFLSFIFFLLHISYGIGTLIGLIKMPFWRKYNKNII